MKQDKNSFYNQAEKIFLSYYFEECEKALNEQSIVTAENEAIGIENSDSESRIEHLILELKNFIYKETVPLNQHSIDDVVSEFAEDEHIRKFKDNRNRLLLEQEKVSAQISSQTEKTRLINRKSAIKNKIEQAEHKLFVDKCLRPNDYLKGRGEVFAMVLPLDKNDNYNSTDDYSVFHLTLLTPAMVYTDYCYFSEEVNESNKPWWYELYRPYLYELWILVPKNDEKWNEFYSNQLDAGFFLGRLYKENNESEYKGKSYKGILRFGGSEEFESNVCFKTSWLDVEELQKNKYNVESYMSRCVNLWNDKRKRIQDIITRDSKDKTKVNPYDTNAFFSNMQFQKKNKKALSVEVKVLNVGQANCIHFHLNTGVSFMFDVGVPYKTNKEGEIINSDYSNDLGNIKDSIKRIKLYKPDFVILSHYHYDHMRGFIHMNNYAMKNSVWVTPIIDENVRDMASLRLALYKAMHNQLIVIKNEDQGKCIFENDIIKLLRGKPHSGSEQYLNDSSLLLLVKNGNASALFAGDCRYGAWPDESVWEKPDPKNAQSKTSDLDNVKYFVVPHHASKQDDISHYDVLLQISANPAFPDRQAIICCGPYLKPIKHPTDEHLSELINKGGFDFGNIRLTGGTLAPHNIDKYEFNYKSVSGVEQKQNVKIERKTIVFTL